MHYGIEVAPFGDLANPRNLARLAKLAEDAGWDGFFIWDGMLHDPDNLPKADPWVALSAVALATERVRFGPMVTPVPRRRPWKLARETVTLDHLSGGRLILGVGLGDPSDEEFEWFGEPGIDHRTRARMLNEGLSILDGLWSGQPFRFDGEFYHLHEMTFLPTPVQQPRIPIWVGGWWPNRAPLRRATRWDGAYLGRLDGPMLLEDIEELVAYSHAQRVNASSLTIVVGDRSATIDRATISTRIGELEEAGATWWLEKAGTMPMAAVEERIRLGPPRS